MYYNNSLLTDTLQHKVWFADQKEPIETPHGSNRWLYRPIGEDKATLGVTVDIIYHIIYGITF